MAGRSINRIMILGNLTRDPELKYTPNGAPVCTFGVATNRTWTTQEGQTKEETQYHRVVAWHKLAELCSKLLAKGRKVYCEGRVSYRSFTGKDGAQRNITEIVLDDFIVLQNGARKIIEEEEEVKLEEEEVTPPSETQVQVEEKSQKERKKRGKSKQEEEEKGTEEERINPDDIPF